MSKTHHLMQQLSNCLPSKQCHLLSQDEYSSQWLSASCSQLNILVSGQLSQQQTIFYMANLGCLDYYFSIWINMDKIWCMLHGFWCRGAWKLACWFVSLENRRQWIVNWMRCFRFEGLGTKSLELGEMFHLDSRLIFGRMIGILSHLKTVGELFFLPLVGIKFGLRWF